MTIFTEAPRVPTNATFAGGIGSLADIAGAAWDSLKYVENANGAYQSLYEAIERRRSTIHGATGVQLSNPLVDAEEEWRRMQTERPQSPFSSTPRETRDQIYNRHLEAFRAELSGLSEKFPASRESIGADRDLWDDAAAIARAADERLGTLMGSRGGLGKYVALLAGGMAGALADPVTLMSLAAGGGPGAARTLAGRVLTIAGKEALINAGTEAAVQPMVQDWRRRAGLEAGTDEAIRNVLLAGAIGGAFGAVGGAAAEIIGRQVGNRQPAVETAAAALPRERLSEPARAILADDGLKAADSIAEIRAALAPEARGALDAAETIRIADELKPPSASPARHDLSLAQADRAVRLADIEAWPGFEPDPAQIERIVREIAGRAGPEQPRDTRRSLTQFIRDAGGIIDDSGELKAIGGIRLGAKPRKGPDRRRPLDMMREAAEEAGYIGRAGEAQTTTVADLLDAIDAELRGQPVYSRLDAGPDIEGHAREAAAFAGLESTVAEIARHAGPGVDDALLARAARLSVEDGLEPFDALERVLSADDAPPAAMAARTGEPMPGWSDGELLAASERRGAWPEPDGLEDPRTLQPEDMDFEAELTRAAGASRPSPIVTAKQIIEGLATDMSYVGKHVTVPGTTNKRGGLERLGPGPIDGTWLGAERTSPGDLGPGTLATMSREEIDALPNPVGKLYVVRDDDQAIIATIKTSRGADTVRRIEHVVVSPELQRRGIAAWLLDRLLEENPAIDLSTSHDGVFSPAGLSFLQNRRAAIEQRAADPIGAADLEDDFMVPAADGRLESVASLRKEIERRETMIAVVEACKA